MTPRERILAYMIEQNQYALASESTFKVTSKQIAEELGMWINEISPALAALTKEGVLIKQGSRPIYYMLSDPKAEKRDQAKQQISPQNIVKERAAFSTVIGHNGSLRLQTELAKAAASYPPNGMHTLIVGASGVGKSMLAEEMWRYYCEKQAKNRPDKPPFVVFNCAEYADNPQLLLAQIFGYVKGAFTGADSDHDGLVDKANGGILFLDEIHRLPAAGQEMFFTLLDQGLFRPLGGTENKIVNLMLIGATTESPDSFLLETFRRRIPIFLQIPSLDERPLNERLNLIVLFLTLEVKRLNYPVFISPAALRLLLLYKSTSNIGNLKNEIQICCARSYLNFLNSNPIEEKPFIHIDDYNLSRKINIETEEQSGIDNFLKALSLDEGLKILPEGTANWEIQDDLSSFDLYKFVEERHKLYRENNESPAAIEKKVASDLKNKYDELLFNKTQQNTYTDLYSMVPDIVKTASSEIIELAEEELNCQFQDGIAYTFAVFLQQVRLLAKADRVIFHLPARLNEQASKPERIFAAQARKIIEQTLEVHLSKGEINLMLLILNQYKIQEISNKIGLVLVALGNATASSIAQFTNQALSTNIVKAIDAPIEFNFDSIVERLCNTVEQADNGNGVLILSDSLIYYGLEQVITERIDIKCRVLPGLCTMMSLEACKEISTTEKDLNDIADTVHAKFQHDLLQSLEYFKTGINTAHIGHKDVIITYCISGTGSAQQIRKLLLENTVISMTAEIIPIGLKDDIHKVVKQYKGRLKVIIGLINPEITGVPYIGIEKFMTPGGLQRVQYLLSGWGIDRNNTSSIIEEADSWDRLALVNEHIYYFAPSIDPDLVIEQSRFITDRIAMLYQSQLQPDMVLRIYIHTASMLERASTTGPIPIPQDAHETIEKSPVLTEKLTSIFSEFEDMYSINVGLSEIYYYLLTLPSIEY